MLIDEPAHPVRLDAGELPKRPPDRLADEELPVRDVGLDDRRQQHRIHAVAAAELTDDREAPQPEVVGGVGASGDGTDQSDLVAFLGLYNAAQAQNSGFGHAPTNIRADQFFVRGARLPYQVFSRNATTF